MLYTKQLGYVPMFLKKHYTFEITGSHLNKNMIVILFYVSTQEHPLLSGKKGN